MKDSSYFHDLTKKILAEQNKSAKIAFWISIALGILLVIGFIFFLYGTS